MADILQIKVPTLEIELGKDSKMDFAGFLRWTIATNTLYNADGEGIRAAVRLERLIRNPRRMIEIDKPDHDRLKQAVEAPANGGYPVRPGARVLPFVDAVAEAKPNPLAPESKEAT